MINTILDTLLRLRLFDVYVFSQWWLYAPLLIPAMCYLWFFMIKWIVLTAPIWLPIRMVISAFREKSS